MQSGVEDGDQAHAPCRAAQRDDGSAGPVNRGLAGQLAGPQGGLHKSWLQVGTISA